MKINSSIFKGDAGAQWFALLPYNWSISVLNLHVRPM